MQKKGNRILVVFSVSTPGLGVITTILGYASAGITFN